MQFLSKFQSLQVLKITIWGYLIFTNYYHQQHTHSANYSKVVNYLDIYLHIACHLGGQSQHSKLFIHSFIQLYMCCTGFYFFFRLLRQNQILGHSTYKNFKYIFIFIKYIWIGIYSFTNSQVVQFMTMSLQYINSSRSRKKQLNNVILSQVGAQLFLAKRFCLEQKQQLQKTYKLEFNMIVQRFNCWWI
eukprot:TRINITY_DN31488_c0_g1_i1.p5 TRINITY_DN31488_c0_g1~~TRINITY_DN31488_c0_g1_i1.p5  ORF type:complete len:189 (+),score=-21.33 TRINITY_DN31488_c0_g1_i1:1093-1659(+)